MQHIEFNSWSLDGMLFLWFSYLSVCGDDDGGGSGGYTRIPTINLISIAFPSANIFCSC